MSPSSRLHFSRIIAASVALVFLTAARAEENLSTIKFSDPAKAGTLKIAVGRGDVRIKGDATTEVSVKSDAKPVSKQSRKDGLRVISASSGFALNEKDNVVTLDALGEGWAGGPVDFQVTVPHNTNIVIASSFGGDVTCAGVSGDLEIKNMTGEIKLEDVSGGALVETMNGEIQATVRELHDGKPLSFTSMNGEVVVRVPANAKANVRLRTQNGSILTDFDETVLVTKSETTPRTGKRTSRTTGLSGSNSLTPEARDAIREATRTAAEAIRNAAQVARDAAQAAREGAHGVTPDSSTPMPAVPPIPPIPPITGGKLVTGVLNGGGPEISVTTMNGDVTLRQSGSGK